MAKEIIAASLLSSDFARLGEEATNVLAAGADWIHLDVMDNHYVPNLTVGPQVCAALRRYGVSAPIDVHLMVRPVDQLIPMFAQAGATSITFHPEASDHIDRTLTLIRAHGCQAGLVLNPATPLDVLHYVIDKLDMVLIMGVNPGFGGQTFIPKTLQKIREAKVMLSAALGPVRLEVDGGIKEDNLAEIHRAGADTFVIGSGIFAKADYAQAIQTYQKILHR